MKERYKVLLIMGTLSLVLWFGVSQFMNTTDEFAQNLDVQDFAYIEPDEEEPEELVVEPERELTREQERERRELAARVRERQDSLQRDSAAPEGPAVPDRSDEPDPMTVNSPEVAEDEDDTEQAEDNPDAETRESLDPDEEGEEPVRADSDADMRAVAEGADQDAADEDGATGESTQAGAGSDDPASGEASGEEALATAQGGTSEETPDRGLPGAVSPSISVPTLDRTAEQQLLQQLEEGMLSGKPPTRAVDVRLATNTRATCAAAVDAPPRVGVYFRHQSSAIKGESLNRMDQLIRLWRLCGRGELVVEPNPQGDIDSDAALVVRRQDEVKYYLLQRSVPRNQIVFNSSR